MSKKNPGPGQSFAYVVKGDSAVILRCFSRDRTAELPACLEGYPVTELAPYAFSAHMSGFDWKRDVQSGKLQLYMPEELRLGQITGADAAEKLPQLSGDRLESVVLPQSLRCVGRYCFYNCSRLKRLEFYGDLSDWGSGAFTGCHQIGQVAVYTDGEGRSSLKEVLDELREELTVEFRFRSGTAYARLVFPEFYEEGVENTPARILETHVHGSGIFFRNCFRDRKYDFAQYDTLFPHVIAQESECLAVSLALSRLRFPYELSSLAKQQYEAYVQSHRKIAADEMLASDDSEGIRWLLDQNRSQTPEGLADGRAADPAFDLLDYLTGEAARLQKPELMSILMEYRHLHLPKQKKRLIL